ncbi:MAG: ABC transporter permease subunit [Bacteroidetes bacterium]|nr:ABC transporter permease subunit [Bacteroidota bacterium]
MIFLTLLYSTFKEAFEKKIILTIFLLIAAVILLFLSFINLDSIEGLKEMLMMSGDESFRDAIIKFETNLINQFSFMVVFCLLLIMSASFIPTILEKGNIDLLLSKPISRKKIVLGKFISVVFLAFIIISLLVSVIWFIISIKTNIWYFPFLTAIIWFTFIFALMYSFELFIGFVSQSTILSLLLTLFLLFPVTALLSVRETMVFSFVKNETIKFVFNFIFYLLPKPWDIRELCINMIEGIAIDSWWPVISSGIFMLVMLSLSVYYFSKKDY